MADLVIDALRAKHGDCLVVQGGGATMLVDGGPPGVYRRFLKPFLENLTADSVDEAPAFDLLMVSHIDADHIAGILDLTSELIDADDESAKPIVQIDEVWHNSFADIISSGSQRTVSRARNESLQVANLVDNDVHLLNAMDDTTFVLASVGQGRRLRQDVERLNIELNSGFQDGLVVNQAEPISRSFKELKLTVVGPGQSDVDDLREKWAKELPAILAKEADKEAATAAAARLDTSVANLSSLVVIAEANGKTALLTGDARGDAVLDFLTQNDLQKEFDILKLPHHGSDRNVTPEFFETVRADHYIMSGDGKHGNPEPETFEMLFNARPELDYKIHMTYGPTELAEHHEFDSAGFRRVMNRDSRRRRLLVFPTSTEKLIRVAI